MRVTARPRAVALPSVSAPSFLVAAAAFATLLGALAGLQRNIDLPAPTGTGDRDAPAARDPLDIGGIASLVAPVAAPGDAPSPVDRAQIVAYYGNPHSASMGILGQHQPERIAALLTEAAARIDKQNGDRAVLPALHIVYAVAQPEPHSDGLYLQRLDDATLREYLDLARRNGLLVVLDVQVGHSGPLAEIQRIERYLREPDVHVALDPEFALAGDVKPGDAIGSIDASAINDVQAYLASLVREHGLPPKLLIVHQFIGDMISNADAIARVAGVDVIIDMDGFGPSNVKRVKYGWYGGAAYAPHAGIKVFLQHDPDPIPEQELLRLDPPPALIVYQ